jgi:hypothetical protein
MKSRTFFFCGFYLEKKKVKRTIFPKGSNLFPNNTAQLMFTCVVLLLSSQIITGDPESQVFSLIFCSCYWWMKILFLKYVFYSSHVKGMWKERLYYFLKVSTFFKCCRFVKNKQTGALLEAKKNNAIFLINQQEIWWQIIYLSRIQEVTFCSYSFIEKMIS